MYSTKLIYSNPFITEEMAQAIASKAFGLSYLPCNIKWRGNAAHQAGDALRVVDRDGVRHTVLIMSQTINFGGGMNGTISCPGETGEEVDGAYGMTTGQKIAAAVGQVDADLKLYIAEVCKLTLEQAYAYTDEAIETEITTALEASY